jgi:uncharacterized protein YidB (DUF937 family)
MGLLDSVIGSLGTSQGGTGGGSALQAIIAMLAQGGGAGGLDGVLRQFQQGGLGDVAASWVGTGQNLPISAEQLRDVLGSDLVAQFAQQLGISPGEGAEQLSELLPQVVDRLTPAGELPTTDAGGLGDLGSLLARFDAR